MTSSMEVSLPSSRRPLTPASDAPGTSVSTLLPLTTTPAALSEPPGVPLSCGD